jgi:FlaA1/EpsC-like NDP-sugar epimerase
LRDGEKLYEELQIGADVSSTQHERILRSREYFMPLSQIAKELKVFETGKEEAARKTLFELALLDH